MTRSVIPSLLEFVWVEGNWMWPICEIGGGSLYFSMHWSRSGKRFDGALMSLLSLKKMRREILWELPLVPLEWLQWISAVEHACSSTESGYWILGNGNKHSFYFGFISWFILTYLIFCLWACHERNKCLAHLFISISRFYFGHKTASTWHSFLVPYSSVFSN